MRNLQASQIPWSLLTACLCFFVLSISGAGSRASSAAQQDGRQGGRQGRLMPPASLSCDRNNTTSFTGRITAYSRSARRIFVRVRTDEQSTEQFTIRLGRGEDASRKFLFQGEAFKAGDWKRIERQRGMLKPGMRAIIWACRDDNDDIHAEVIDWRPNENEGSFVL